MEKKWTFKRLCEGKYIKDKTKCEHTEALVSKQISFKR